MLNSASAQKQRHPRSNQDTPERRGFRLLAALAASVVFHGAVLHGIGHGPSATSHAGGPGKARPGPLDARLVQRPQPATPTNPAPQTGDPVETRPLRQTPHQETQAGDPDGKHIPASGKASVAADNPSPAGNAIVDVPVFEIPFAPRYPLPLLSKGVRGTVTIGFKVSRIGSAEEIQLIDSAPAGLFDAAVIDALMRAQLDIDSVRPGSAWVVTVVFDATGTNPQGPVSQSILRAKP